MRPSSDMDVCCQAVHDSQPAWSDYYYKYLSIRIETISPVSNFCLQLLSSTWSGYPIMRKKKKNLI